ncbi:MAG: type II toxin-antitoxin system HipA family toxin [Bdellovibrionales bacterium]
MIDFKKITTAQICLRNQLAGILKRVSEVEYSFQYDSSYLQKSKIQIATSLPLREEAYKSKKLHSFFDNLIAEGWLLHHTEKVFHIDKANRFALLMATGNAPIGAVTVHPLDASGKIIDFINLFRDDLDSKKMSLYTAATMTNFVRCPGCLRPSPLGITHKKCALEMWGTTRKIRVELDPRAPLNSFARVVYGGSISGAQKKGLFHFNESKGVLSPTPTGAQYILKPMGDYPELPQNEHVTMAIAKELGFEVPSFTILNIEKIGFIFAIKRFDRENDEPLMLEDMGQVINVPSADKYDASYEKVAKAIALYSSAPPIDLNLFFRRLIFSYFIANADMHLKNWSLLENAKALGTYKLSPCYDFLNTRLPIPSEKIDIGLTLNGKLSNLKRSYFIDFGTKIGLSAKAIDKVFSEIDNWWRVTEDFVTHCLLTEDSKSKYLKIVKARHKILRG